MLGLRPRYSNDMMYEDRFCMWRGTVDISTPRNNRRRLNTCKMVL
jgi:hypothetical protein